MPAAVHLAARPVVLVILDGFGCREATPDNAIARAKKPNLDRLFATCPHTSIDASERSVGLPSGQMGNSEVGHLNIGAGRVIYQDYTRIDHAIETGEFARNAALVAAVATAKARGTALHVLGLVSPGGVHSHERQIGAMIEIAATQGAPLCLVHAFLDGRDTPPRSAAASLAYLEDICRPSGARIASIVGRYYAMDRDQRWERVAEAYDLVVDGAAPYKAASARAGLDTAYARGETDEFVHATAIVDGDGVPSRMADGDVVVFMNFRADRARQLTRALTSETFDGFARPRAPKLAVFVCLTSYGDEFRHLPVAFAPQSVAMSFGEYIASLGLTQLRIAETERRAAKCWSPPTTATPRRCWMTSPVSRTRRTRCVSCRASTSGAARRWPTAARCRTLHHPSCDAGIAAAGRDDRPVASRFYVTRRGNALRTR
jgi:2,3-bisphosphoglycerate-independent phosphoglycerate mutase